MPMKTAGAVAPPPSPDGYTVTARAFHWLIAVLLGAQYIVAVLMPNIGPKTLPGPLIDLHFSLGVVILVLMALRLLHRLARPVPLDLPDSPPWERTTALVTHRLFYLILLVAPFLGWASASAHRLPVSLFGLVPLPALAAPRARWAFTAGDLHRYAMWTLLVLIGFHALAALHHHFVRRDGVLRRMLPAHR